MSESKAFRKKPLPSTLKCPFRKCGAIQPYSRDRYKNVSNNIPMCNGYCDYYQKNSVWISSNSVTYASYSHDKDDTTTTYNMGWISHETTG